MHRTCCRYTQESREDQRWWDYSSVYQCVSLRLLFHLLENLLVLARHVHQICKCSNWANFHREELVAASPSHWMKNWWIAHHQTMGYSQNVNDKFHQSRRNWEMSYSFHSNQLAYILKVSCSVKINFWQAQCFSMFWVISVFWESQNTKTYHKHPWLSSR